MGRVGDKFLLSRHSLFQRPHRPPGKKPGKDEEQKPDPNAGRRAVLPDALHHGFAVGGVGKGQKHSFWAGLAEILQAVFRQKARLPSPVHAKKDHFVKERLIRKGIIISLLQEHRAVCRYDHRKMRNPDLGSAVKDDPAPGSLGDLA